MYSDLNPESGRKTWTQEVEEDRVGMQKRMYEFRSHYPQICKISLMEFYYLVKKMDVMSLYDRWEESKMQSSLDQISCT